MFKQKSVRYSETHVSGGKRYEITFDIVTNTLLRRVRAYLYGYLYGHPFAFSRHVKEFVNIISIEVSDVEIYKQQWTLCQKEITK